MVIELEKELDINDARTIVDKIGEDNAYNLAALILQVLCEQNHCVSGMNTSMISKDAKTSESADDFTLGLLELG